MKAASSVMPPPPRVQCNYVLGPTAPKFNGSIFVGGGIRFCSRLAAPGAKCCAQHIAIKRRASY